jgi:ribosomal protein L40E
MDCSICGVYVQVDALTCHTCGAPTDDRALSGQRSICSLCGEVLWSLAERCQRCEAKGYPALRPRMGDKSLRAPEAEEMTA